MFARGSRLRASPLTLIHRPGSRGLQVVVVARGIKGAVRRNRIRRRVREIMRVNPDLFNSGLDVVVRAGEGSEELSSRALREIIRRAAARLSRVSGGGDPEKSREKQEC